MNKLVLNLLHVCVLGTFLVRTAIAMDGWDDINGGEPAHENQDNVFAGVPAYENLDYIFGGILSHKIPDDIFAGVLGHENQDDSLAGVPAHENPDDIFAGVPAHENPGDMSAGVPAHGNPNEISAGVPMQEPARLSQLWRQAFGNDDHIDSVSLTEPYIRALLPEDKFKLSNARDGLLWLQTDKHFREVAKFTAKIKTPLIKSLTQKTIKQGIRTLLQLEWFPVQGIDFGAFRACNVTPETLQSVENHVLLQTNFSGPKVYLHLENRDGEKGVKEWSKTSVLPKPLEPKKVLTVQRRRSDTQSRRGFDFIEVWLAPAKLTDLAQRQRHGLVSISDIYESQTYQLVLLHRRSEQPLNLDSSTFPTTFDERLVIKEYPFWAYPSDRISISVVTDANGYAGLRAKHKKNAQDELSSLNMLLDMVDMRQESIFVETKLGQVDIMNFHAGSVKNLTLAYEFRKSQDSYDCILLKIIKQCFLEATRSETTRLVLTERWKVVPR